MKEKAKPNGQVRIGNEGCRDDSDTQSLKQLPDSFESTLAIGTDPYSNDADRSGLRRRRRSLDDMRELNDQIKRGELIDRNGPQEPSKS
jgi:hypothetical protein